MRPTATEHRQGDTLVLRDTFEPTAVQQRFWHECNRPYSEVEEVLFDGSIRGGKTQAAVKVICAWAMKYGGTYVISRFSYRELEDSTKKACLHGDGGMPPAIPAQLIAKNPNTGRPWINETHNYVTLVNGAQILFRALEPNERGKVRNITAAAWFIDQAEELEGDDIADFYQEIKGRCSDPRGPRKMLLVANPGPADHMIAERFVDAATAYKKGSRVHCTIYDNRSNLPEDYFQMLLATEETNPTYFRRMVMGEWGVMGGRRFKVWNPAIHVVEPFDIPSGWTILEGGDYGWTNPTVWLWEALDFEGIHWIVAEHAATETDVADHAKAIKGIRAGRPDYHERRPFQGQLEPSAAWLDPSAWNKREGESIALNFQQHGIYVGRAKNERVGGWNRIGELLANRNTRDGGPRLRVFRNCPTLIRELPNLHTKPGTDDVEKINDHASDALRYIEMSQMPSPEEEQEEEQFTRQAHMDKYRRKRRELHQLEDGPREPNPALWVP